MPACDVAIVLIQVHLPTCVCRWLQGPEILVVGVVGVCMHHSSVTTNLATPPGAIYIRDDPSSKSRAIYDAVVGGNRIRFFL